MARRRRGGFGGIIVLLAGAWLIGVFAGDKEQPDPVRTTPPLTTTRSNNTDVDADRTSPSTRVETVPTTPDAVDDVTTPRWIRGSKVAFRAGPGTSFAILDRFGAGRRVALMSIAGDWSKVRDELTRREGWIATRFLSDREPAKRRPQIEKREQSQEPVAVPRPEISDAEIVDRIIAASIAGYSGNCPCPFNRDRAGRRCGKRSAYSRPGGASPICFAGDVTPDMIEAFRRR